MNALTKAGVKAEDKLFATVNTTSRTLYLGEEYEKTTEFSMDTEGNIDVERVNDYTKKPKKQEVLVTDTVGFVSRLPHEFVEAFKSTLEEAAYADLILVVVDGTSTLYEDEYNMVLTVLDGIGARALPRINIINKCDAVPLPFSLSEQFEGGLTNTVYPDIPSPRFFVSALKGDGIAAVKTYVKNFFFKG